MRKDYEINIYKELIHIKYYKRVIDINDKNIIIEIENNKIIIHGNNLFINKLDKYELSIKGEFRGIDLLNE